MRRTLLVAALLAIAAPATASESFKALYEAHEWFELRDAVASASDAPPLYQGAVACAFHDLRAAEKHLRRVVAAAPRSADAIEAHGVLITVAQMDADYGRALAEIRALQPIVSDSGGLENGAAFFSALVAFPRQGVSKRRPGTVRCSLDKGNLFVPVMVNRHAATYIVDTGANFSLISEGEARRLGLAIHEAPGSHGTDAAGSSVAFRLALAERLSIGAFELRNVTFLVASDEQQPFADLPSTSRGVIGIPVLLALETIRWHADGRFEIGVPGPRGTRREANLCFDGANPQVNAQYQGRPIRVFLDLGATTTRLMPAFARDFPEAIEGAKTGPSTVRGVGDSAKVDAAFLENVMLQVGGRDLRLPSAEALLKDLPGQRDRFHVWAGLDLFAAARAVTVDFRSMRLEVE